jgi:hypothetical protein
VEEFMGYVEKSVYGPMKARIINAESWNCPETFNDIFPYQISIKFAQKSRL